MAVAVVALLAVAGTAAGARAPRAPVFALQPVTSGPYYVFHAHPGQTVSGRVRVVNTGSAAGTARIYAVDATTGATSGASYLTDSRRRSDVGAWTRLSVGQVHLRPRQSKIVAFTMRVPKGARTGDHLGGIVADPGVQRGRAVKRSRSSFRINVRTLTVIAVEAQLPGKRVPQMAIDDVTAGGMRGYQQLFLGLRNTGNIFVKGSGSVVVENMGGQRLKSSTFALDTFLPQTQIAFPVLIHGKALPSGTYRATVTVHYAHRTVTGTFTFKIGKRELAQVFGSKATGTPGVGGTSLLLMIGAGVAFLLAGFAAAAVMFKRRERRIAARLRDLDELELWRLQAGAAAEPVAAVTHDDSQSRLDS
jgi:WxL interacting protein linking bacterial and host surfaces